MTDVKEQATTLATAAVTDAVTNPNVAAEASAIPAIMTALTPVLDAILKSTAASPWYQSKTVWSGIISMLAVVLGLVGVAFPAQMQGTALTIVMALVPAVGGLLAWYAHYRQGKKAIVINPTKPG